MVSSKILWQSYEKYQHISIIRRGFFYVIVYERKSLPNRMFGRLV